MACTIAIIDSSLTFVQWWPPHHHVTFYHQRPHHHTTSVIQVTIYASFCRRCSKGSFAGCLALRPLAKHWTTLPSSLMCQINSLCSSLISRKTPYSCCHHRDSRYFSLLLLLCVMQIHSSKVSSIVKKIVKRWCSIAIDIEMMQIHLLK